MQVVYCRNHAPSADTNYYKAIAKLLPEIYLMLIKKQFNVGTSFSANLELRGLVPPLVLGVALLAVQLSTSPLTIFFLLL